MIFKPLLISTTGYLEPVSRAEAFYRKWAGSSSHSGPIFYLAIRTLAEAFDPLSFRQFEKVPRFVSISLLRVCRSIYQETNALFWKSNTFVFSTPCILQSAFEKMGKFATRRMIYLGLSFPMFDLPEFAFPSAAKRVADRSLLRLDIVIHPIELHSLLLLRELSAYGEDPQEERKMYRRFLRKVNNISKLRIPKRLIIMGHGRSDESRTADYESLMHDMEESWGDKMCGDEV